MSPVRTLLLRLSDPPLGPSADAARSRVRGELLKPEYHTDNLLQRFLDWVGRLFDDGLNAASRVGSLPTVAAMVVFLALVVALGLLLSRARRSARVKAESRAVLTDEVVTAGELRARAEEALAQGRHEDAVIEAFRALALRQVERGRLEDSPGATAHEVALALIGEFPQRRADVDAGALLFETVLYGGRAADREQAVSVLALDDELAGAR